MNAYGIHFDNLPGSWPPSAGPARISLRWRAEDRAFEPSPHWWFRETDDGLIVHFEDEGEFHLKRGPEPEVSVTLGPPTDRQAALAFLMSVVPLGLPLFDLEPFHGAALESTDGAALLVLGHAEAGKSTTATVLRGRGLSFLADDACAIDDAGRLWPGPPLLGVFEPGPRDRRFAEYDDKVIVAVSDHDTSPREVGSVVILGPQEGGLLGIRSLSGREAVEALLRQVRAPKVMPRRRERLQFQAAVGLARGPVGVVSYDKAEHAPDDVAGTILEWVRDDPASGSPI